MINNRQAGRRRGRGGGGNNNGPRTPGRPDNGNRIDNRARGNAAQLLEKYKSLAADAQRQGDRVNIEYYLQFADHYFRVLAEQRGRFEDQPRRQRDDFDMDGDDDFADEGEPIRQGEQQMEQRRDRDDRPDRQERPDRQDRGERQARGEGQDRDRQDRDRQDRDRPDRERMDRGDRPQRDAQDRGDRQPRDNQARDNQDRPDRQPRAEGYDRGDRQDRDDRPRYDREPRPARPAQVEVAGQHRADPIVEGESLGARAEAVLEADAPLAPRRRGRPRRVVEEEEGGTAAPTLDADLLPPSLMTPANDAGTGDEAKPRRRRIRPTEASDAAE